VAVISETNKKLKISKHLQYYLLNYGGVPQEKIESSRVAILINKKYKIRFHSYAFVNERIMNLRIKIARGYLTVVGINSPEFYKILQNIWIQ
jgi:hypothetical protein